MRRSLRSFSACWRSHAGEPTTGVPELEPVVIGSPAEEAATGSRDRGRLACRRALVAACGSLRLVTAAVSNAWGDDTVPQPPSISAQGNSNQSPRLPCRHGRRFVRFRRCCRIMIDPRPRIVAPAAQSAQAAIRAVPPRFDSSHLAAGLNWRRLIDGGGRADTSIARQGRGHGLLRPLPTERRNP